MQFIERHTSFYEKVKKEREKRKERKRKKQRQLWKEDTTDCQMLR